MTEVHTLDELKNLPLHYEEGHDDPDADIRYRDGPIEKIAGGIFTDDQLNYVLSQLGPTDKPIEFYVSTIWYGPETGLEVALTLEMGDKIIQKELYFSKDQLEPEKAEFYWKEGLDLRLTLDDYYERWLDDPWR